LFGGFKGRHEVIDHNNLKYKRNYNLETNLAHQPTFPVGLWHSVLVSVSTGTVIINQSPRNMHEYLHPISIIIRLYHQDITLLTTS